MKEKKWIYVEKLTDEGLKIRPKLLVVINE